MVTHLTESIVPKTVSDDQLVIQLKTNITIEELITKFRKYLAWDVLLAFENKQTVAKLKGENNMSREDFSSITECKRLTLWILRKL